jgi:NAD dependent epimerase/dehydratase
MSILEGKQVLVTGADGFIGSHLVEALVAAGARVRALAQYNSFNFWGWLEELPCLAQVEVVTGDVRDAQCCRQLTKDVDTVFHLAALIPIPYSYRAPDSYVDTNVKGTLYMCQAARESGVRRFVQTSTSEVYGTARQVPIDERHPLNAQSPYSATKIASDAIAMSFFYSFSLPVVIARPFNTYGPRQSARAVIPSIITQIAGGKEEIQLGELNSTRDFTFVEDTVRGFVALAEMKGGDGETFHIGSGFEISVADTVKLIAQAMNRPVRVTQDEKRMRPASSEVFRLWCDNSKLRQASGFTPQVSIEEGLRRTVGWFTDDKNLARYKGGLYNV